MKFFSRREMNRALSAIEADKDTEDMKEMKRKSLRQLGLVSATGALFYACGKSDSGSVKAATAAECKAVTDAAEAAAKTANSASDVGVLNAALNLEQEAIAVYTAAAGLGIWTGGNAPVYKDIAVVFRDHHAAHAGKLASVITELGGTPITTKTASEYFTANGIADPAALGLGDVLKFALKKELGAAQAYASLAGTMKFVPCAGLFAQLAADEAAHYAVFRAAFTFLDPTVTDDAAYTAKASPKFIIPGAYPADWTIPS